MGTTAIMNHLLHLTTCIRKVMLSSFALLEKDEKSHMLSFDFACLLLEMNYSQLSSEFSKAINITLDSMKLASN